MAIKTIPPSLLFISIDPTVIQNDMISDPPPTVAQIEGIVQHNT